MMLSIFSCAYWPSVCLLWRNIHLDPLPVLNWVVDLFIVEFFFFFLAAPCGSWALSSPVRDLTWAHGSENAES